MQREPAVTNRTDVGESLIDRLLWTSDAILRWRAVNRRGHLHLTEMQHRVLVEVAQHEPISVTGLARLVHRDNAQVSRTLNCLVDGNFLTRTRRPGSTSAAIRLTPTGRATLSKVEEVTKQWEDTILGELSPDELAVVNDAMRRLYDVTLDMFGNNNAGNAESPILEDRAKAASRSSA